ncbi:Mss4-like protein [Aspergillus egyptiacus]|nr:Mss4-like protein [Aspergillus egyptiacus]
MTVGGCFCGKIRIKYNGQPLTSALCHCLDCRKLTGSPYTYNYVVRSADLEIASGSPKAVAKTSDSGNQIRNYFCPDCGTPLFGHKITPDGGSGEITIVRVGIFDDMEILSERIPEAEIYTDRRLEWIGPVDGAEQFSGMVSL